MPLKFKKSGKFGQKQPLDPFTQTKIAARLQSRLLSKDPVRSLKKGALQLANIFLSHSSKDKEFVKWLASQLKELGHQPWFDEWEIKIGDCIPSKIERGIGECDYVVIVLSPNAINSSWVDREWKAKYWSEIQKNSTLVLPVLLEECDIPLLLQTRKYADFTGPERAAAFANLILAITPVLNPVETIKSISLPIDGDVHSLLAKVGAKKEPLAAIIAESLALAHKVKSKDLEIFCRGELTGWVDKPTGIEDKALSYRLIEAFASPHQVNMNYIGWNGSAQNIFNSFKQNPNQFKPVKFFMNYSVTQFESFLNYPQPANSYLHVTMPFKNYNPDYLGDAIVYIYMRGDSYETILGSIRQQLTQHLINLLPQSLD